MRHKYKGFKENPLILTEKKSMNMRIQRKQAGLSRATLEISSNNFSEFSL
jgi:hypothetical protein